MSRERSIPRVRRSSKGALPRVRRSTKGALPRVRGRVREGAPGSRHDRILARIRAIPKGSVRTYGDIEPSAPRLVGRILATTHADVPWYRVVRADGRVAMGKRQLELLRREGVPLKGDRVDLRHARYTLSNRPLPG